MNILRINTSRVEIATKLLLFCLLSLTLSQFLPDERLELPRSDRSAILGLALLPQVNVELL